MVLPCLLSLRYNTVIGFVVVNCYLTAIFWFSFLLFTAYQGSDSKLWALVDRIL